ncbi:MAG: hypothetical protein ACR2RB_22865 [Gammaproteobacteria bacterium]
MKRFPASVRRAMREIDAAATCVPVQLDGGDWETAMFVKLAGSESQRDLEVLKRGARLPLGLEADLIENESAAVVVIRVEVHTVPDDPMALEILLTPGAVTGHFETLKSLTRQDRLCWFFSDDGFGVIHSQQHAWSREQQSGMESILLDAVKHDAVIRMTGRYDAQTALGAIVSLYEPRPAATVPKPQPPGGSG